MSVAVRQMPLADVMARWQLVAERWDLAPAERSALIGGGDLATHGRVEAYRQLCGEQRIRLVVEAEPVFRKVVGGDESVRNWLRSANVNLAGRTPLEVMAASPEWLRWLIDSVGEAT